MTSADLVFADNRELSRLESLTHLLSCRSVDDLLADALAMLISGFQSSGGSILYVSTSVRRVRQGDLSDAARQRIDSLEETTAARIHYGARHIQLPSAPPVTRDELPGQQGMLFVVPLGRQDRTCGMVSLFTRPPADLNHRQLQELSWLVGCISAIATNVDQLIVNRQRLNQLGFFYQVGQVMTSTFDADRLFEDTIDLAISVIDAEQAELMLIDDDRQQLMTEVKRGRVPLPRARYVRLGRGIAGWVAEHNEPVLVNDVGADDRFDPRIDGSQQHAVRNLICVPLQIKGKAIGVLQVFNKRSPLEFDQEDLSVLVTLAAQVSIALDNARLYNSLRAERDKIIEIQETIRHEVARNLHDGPVQLLAAIGMGLDYLERLIQVKPEDVPDELDSLRKLVRRAAQDARLLLFELRPVILETQGLVSTLESYVERLRQSERFAVHFDPGDFSDQLSSPFAGTIFAIVQEAVTNIQKHADARNVWIRLREEGGELVVCVEDDGRGFNLDSVISTYDQGSSFGLLNMKERAELIDGVVTMESGPERDKPGTLVQLRVTLPNT